MPSSLKYYFLYFTQRFSELASRFKLLFLLLAVGIAPSLSVFSSLAHAQDFASACNAEGPRLCSGLSMENDLMFYCLVNRLHESILSKPCAEHVRQLLGYKDLCSKDIQHHCQNQPFYCLLTAKSADLKLTPACQDAVFFKAQYQQNCRSEIHQFCKTQKTPRALLACLRKNVKEQSLSTGSAVSSACLKSIE